MKMLCKRNFIVVAQRHPVADIELRIGTVERERFRRVKEIGAIVDQYPQCIRDVIQTMRPSVVRVEGKSVPESPDGFQLQSIVAGGPDTFHLRDAVKTRVDQVVL